ncbi:tetratricopeptide repeat protein [Clostridium fungisolvens]|uniref:tetratricopeptide repeat protein n=1 Tax=Clostridium fungisolvens TaxID=1604897 RepID=UPI0016166EF4|nr:tetratricopeptide repeat protein [Clostridium fungisolvens]
MDYNSLFKDKLSKLLFLEIRNVEAFLKKISDKQVKLKNKELFIPVSMEFLAEKVKQNQELKDIPLYEFIEGMFYAIGADEKFSYNEDYKSILDSISNSKEAIKGIVASKVKQGNYNDSYVLLRGLCRSYGEEEIFEKLLVVGSTIRENNRDFKNLHLEDIENYKKVYPKSALPYMYEALTLKDEGEYSKVLMSLNEYIRLGGERSTEIEQLFLEVSDIVAYEKGKEEIDVNPLEAIKKLLPLLDKFEDNPLIYYYIGLSYRKLDNYEKAIYYLNESLEIDSSIVETVNELGINYAAIGDFENAIMYFRKAFEATKDVEICTNLVMCYYNIGKMDDAKIHLDIANKLEPNDEIVKQLNKIIGG